MLEEHIFLYQGSRLGYTPVRNKSSVGGQDFGVSLKRDAKQNFQPMLREPCMDSVPAKNKFEYGKNS